MVVLDHRLPLPEAEVVVHEDDACLMVATDEAVVVVVVHRHAAVAVAVAVVAVVADDVDPSWRCRHRRRPALASCAVDPLLVHR